MPQDSAVPYDAEWRQYRRWNRVFWGLWLGWVPLGLAVLRLFNHPQSMLQPLIFPVLLGYMAATGYFGFRTMYFGCPRCGRKFFPRWRTQKPFTFRQTCRHCGLPKWAGSERQPLAPHEREG